MSIQVKNFQVMREFVPYYHYGLGIWIKSRKQFKDELRVRNLEEVGNEIPRNKDGKKMVKNPFIGRT